MKCSLYSHLRGKEKDQCQGAIKRWKSVFKAKSNCLPGKDTQRVCPPVHPKQAGVIGPALCTAEPFRAKCECRLQRSQSPPFLVLPANPKNSASCKSEGECVYVCVHVCIQGDASQAWFLGPSAVIPTHLSPQSSPPQPPLGTRAESSWEGGCMGPARSCPPAPQEPAGAGRD